MPTAYDTANIILPQSAGYKAGTLYGWNPQGGNLVDFPVVRSAGTATRVNKLGLIESVAANVPRWDWSEGLACPSLLRENAVTNVFYNSDPSSSPGVGTITAVTFAANDWGIGLNGKVLFGDNSTLRNFYNSNTTTDGVTYTAQMIVKPANGLTFTIGGAPTDLFNFRFNNTQVQADPTFSYNVQPYPFGSGLFKVSIKYTVNASTAGILNGVVKQASNNAIALEVSAIEIKNESAPSSYVPTSGSSETRNKDEISAISIGSLLGQTEGTFVIRASIYDNSSNQFFSLAKDTNDVVRLGNAAGGAFTSQVRVGGSAVGVLGAGTLNNNIAYTFAVRYKTNDMALAQGGAIIATDTSGVVDYTSNNLTEFRFDNGGTGGEWFGRIYFAAVYDYALDNSALVNIAP